MIRAWMMVSIKRIEQGQCDQVYSTEESNADIYYCFRFELFNRKEKQRAKSVFPF